MHGETQANRLAALMQKKAQFPCYELTLPLGTVKRSFIERLSVDDIFLLGFKHLECMLCQDGKIYANVRLMIKNDRHYLNIVENNPRVLEVNDSPKYGQLLFSLGTVKSRTLEVGHLIDISQYDLAKVTVIQKDKKIAKGTLINVEGELAIQLDKVEKYE